MKTRRVTENGLTWVEVVPWAPPAVDQPITPLVQATPEVALPGGLHGDPDRANAERRRRAANAVLEKHGLRPRPWT